MRAAGTPDQNRTAGTAFYIRLDKDPIMRSIPIVASLLLLAGAVPAFAEEGGCLKYGAAGAAAGHFVGSGHAVAGAAAGCAAGAQERNKAEKKDAAQQKAAASQQRQPAPPKSN